MKLSKPTLINAGLAIVVIGGGLAAFLVANPITAASNSESTRLTGTVQEGVVASTITATGSVAAVREVSASFAASGTIATVDVALGQTVEAGQQLGTLDTLDLSSAVSSAYTQLSRARSDLGTAKATLATAQAEAANPTGGAGSGQSVSQAQSAVTSANDKVTNAATAASEAEADLAAATLASPITGLVVAINGTVGATTGSSGGATADSSFVTIADVSQFTMTAAIAEADIADVAVGQAAAVAFPALPDATTTAAVTAISPTATASNSVVTYATTITLDSIPEGLRLGQTASVTITTRTSAEDALYVPTAAITTAGDGTSTVEVVGDDGETTEVTVVLGIAGDQGTEIVSGLELGDTVVLGTVAETGNDSDTGVTREMGGFSGVMPGGGVTTGGFPGGDR